MCQDNTFILLHNVNHGIKLNIDRKYQNKLFNVIENIKQSYMCAITLIQV